MPNIEFHIEEDHVVDATRRATVRRLTSSTVGRVLVGGVVLAMVFGAVLSLLSGDWSPLVTMLLMVAIGAATITLLTRFVTPAMARRHHRQMAAFRDPVTVSWTDEGLSLESSRGSIRMAWKDFVDWAETPTVFLLYQSDLLYNLIPRSAVTSEEEADLRRLLQSIRRP